MGKDIDGAQRRSIAGWLAGRLAALAAACARYALLAPEAKAES